MRCKAIPLAAACLLGLILGVTSAPVRSQTGTWNVIVQIDPFPSPYLSDWETNPGTARALVENGTDQGLEIITVLSLTHAGRGRLATARSQPMFLAAGESRDLGSTELADWSSLDYDSGLQDAVVRSGRLPEGDYELCVQVQEAATGAALAEGCASLSVLYPDPPYLISPGDGENVDTEYPLFQWTPLQVPPGFDITFTLRLAELIPGQVPSQALAANPVHYEATRLGGTSLPYPLDALPLTPGKTYAWQVQAFDRNGIAPSANDGKSEIWTFVYGGPGGTAPPPAAGPGDQFVVRLVTQDGGLAASAGALAGNLLDSFETFQEAWNAAAEAGQVILPLPGLLAAGGQDLVPMDLQIGQRAHFAFDAEKRSFAIFGTAELMGLADRDFLLVVSWNPQLILPDADDSSATGHVLVTLAIRRSQFSVGSLNAQMSGTVLDEIALDDALFVLSNHRTKLTSAALPEAASHFYANFEEWEVEAGLNCRSELRLEGSERLQDFARLMGFADNRIVITGKFSPALVLFAPQDERHFEMSLKATFPERAVPASQVRWMKSKTPSLEIAFGYDAATATRKPSVTFAEKIVGSFSENAEHTFTRATKLERESHADTSGTSDATTTLTRTYKCEDVLTLGTSWLEFKEVTLALGAELDGGEASAALSGKMDIAGHEVGELKVELSHSTSSASQAGSNSGDSSESSTGPDTGPATDQPPVSENMQNPPRPESGSPAGNENSQTTSQTKFKATAKLNVTGIVDLIRLAASIAGESTLGDGFEIPTDLFTLSDVTLTFEVGGGSSFDLDAMTELRGAQTQIHISTSRPVGGLRRLLVGIKPSHWSLTETIPALANPILDGLDLSQVAMIVANGEFSLEPDDLSEGTRELFARMYGSEDYRLQLSPGINLIATIPMDAVNSDGVMAKVMGMLGMQPGVLYLQGGLGSPFALITGQGGGGASLLRDLSLRASLPPMRPPLSPPWFVEGVLALEITGAPSVGVVGEITIDMDGDILTFSATAQVARSGSNVALQLIGVMEAEQPWVAPLGIDWLVMKRVALLLDVNAVGNIGLGFSGDMVVGQKDVAGAVYIAVNAYTGVPSNFIFNGESEAGVGISDLIELQAKMMTAQAAVTGGASAEPSLPLDALPDIEFRDLKLRFAPKSEPALEVEAGFGIKAQMWLQTDPCGPLENFCGAEVDVGLEGIICNGHLNEFVVGPLTWHDAVVDLALTVPDRHFLVDGEVELLGSRQKLMLSIAKGTMAFESERKIAGLYMSHLEAAGSCDLRNPYFRVHGLLRNDFTENREIIESLTSAIGERAQQTAAVLGTEAQQATETAGAAAREFSDFIQSEEVKRAAANAILENATRNLNEAASERAEAARQVDAAQKAYNNAKFGQRTARLAELTAAKAHFRAKDAAYKASEAAHDVKVAAAGWVLTAPRIEDTSIARRIRDTKQAAEERAERLRQRAALLTEPLQLLSSIHIKQAEFECSLDDLVQGRAVLMKMNMEIGGTAYDLVLDWDFGDMVKNAAQLAGAVAEALKG